jgi:hypothetical protein
MESECHGAFAVSHAISDCAVGNLLLTRTQDYEVRLAGMGGSKGAFRVCSVWYIELTKRNGRNSSWAFISPLCRDCDAVTTSLDCAEDLPARNCRLTDKLRSACIMLESVHGLPECRWPRSTPGFRRLGPDRRVAFAEGSTNYVNPARAPGQRPGRSTTVGPPERI